MEQLTIDSIMHEIDTKDFWKDFTHPYADKVERIVRDMKGQTFLAIYRAITDKIKMEDYRDYLKAVIEYCYKKGVPKIESSFISSYDFFRVGIAPLKHHNSISYSIKNSKGPAYSKDMLPIKELIK